VLVKSSQQWQSFRYATPHALPSTLQLLRESDERGEALLLLADQDVNSHSSAAS
jgi:hypothetical protein